MPVLVCLGKLALPAGNEGSATRSLCGPGLGSAFWFVHTCLLCIESFRKTPTSEASIEDQALDGEVTLTCVAPAPAVRTWLINDVNQVLHLDH